MLDARILPPMNQSEQPKGALAVIAALPREMTSFARDLGLVQTYSRDGIVMQQSRNATQEPAVVVVTAGMGAGRAALAVEAALAQGAIAALLSAGLAGACNPQLHPATCLAASLVVDSRTGERFRTDPALTPEAQAILVTAPTLAGPAEKLRLHHAYAAAAVDMEAATVARLARAHGIPFAAIKAISEAQPVDLTHLATFSGPRGEFRTAAFALHTAIHPARWPAAFDLAQSSSAALAALTGALLQFVRAAAHDLS